MITILLCKCRLMFYVDQIPYHNVQFISFLNIKISANRFPPKKKHNFCWFSKNLILYLLVTGLCYTCPLQNNSSTYLATRIFFSSYWVLYEHPIELEGLNSTIIEFYCGPMSEFSKKVPAIPL